MACSRLDRSSRAVMARLAAVVVGSGLLGACATGPSLILSPQPRSQADCSSSAGAELGDLAVRRIAVLPFSRSVERRTESYAPPPAARLPNKPLYRYLPDDGASATTSIENALSARPGFTVIERRELDRLLGEQRLQLTGLVSAKEAVGIGKLSGAEAVLMGLVNHAYAGYENVTVAGSWVGTYIPHADISMRLVHVESGKIIWSCQLSRNALNYLDRPLTLNASRTVADPHAYDGALMGTTVEERIEGILRAAARDAVELLPGK